MIDDRDFTIANIAGAKAEEETDDEDVVEPGEVPAIEQTDEAAGDDENKDD